MQLISISKKALAWEERNSPALASLDIGATARTSTAYWIAVSFSARSIITDRSGNFGPALYKLTEKGLQILEAKKTCTGYRGNCDAGYEAHRRL